MSLRAAVLQNYTVCLRIIYANFIADVILAVVTLAITVVVKIFIVVIIFIIITTIRRYPNYQSSVETMMTSTVGPDNGVVRRLRVRV